MGKTTALWRFRAKREIFSPATKRSPSFRTAKRKEPFSIGAQNSFRNKEPYSIGAQNSFRNKEPYSIGAKNSFRNKEPYSIGAQNSFNTQPSPHRRGARYLSYFFTPPKYFYPILLLSTLLISK
jgi:hypothetical protein